MKVTFRSGSLPAILIAAFVQGWALYALHLSILSHRWPSSDPAWLSALYVATVFIPATVQLLAEYTQRRATWLLVASLSISFLVFGWSFGDKIVRQQPGQLGGSDQIFFFSFEMLVLWLLVLPFFQSRLSEGHWRIDYRALFTHAWRNKIALAEAALFTGLFWLLLGLWQALFHMLQVDFFRNLFEQPLFKYPVTAVVFGSALHLIGSIDRLISAVLEQTLNVLKWLAIVAGALLALFTITLLIKLPGLVFEGQKAIGAAWLLWLVAVVVLFLNAAYRDGSVAQPYPRWLGLALRIVIPLTIVIGVTALYALYIREMRYGITVERFWAFIVAGAALLYATGYSMAAVRAGPWLGGMARVNVFVALTLIVTIALALTPVTSPYRLAANSQYNRILKNPEEQGAQYKERTAFHYLRWEAGDYGRKKLKDLSVLENHRNADRIRALASAALQEKTPWAFAPNADAATVIASLPIFPAGRAPDAGLAALLSEEVNKPETYFVYQSAADHSLSGLFVDLRGDGSEEFVVLSCCAGLVYERRVGGWARIGSLSSSGSTASLPTIEAALKNGQVATMTPQWKELVIGGHIFHTNVAQK